MKLPRITREQALGWIEERTGIVSWFREEVLEKRVPHYRGIMDFSGCFGGLSLVFFAVQVITGMFLLAHYVPHPDYAYRSVQIITAEVPLGWLVRKIHATGAGFMVITMILHVMRVFFTQAYKAPRELHWVSGVLLFGLVLAMNFTGYLLPWTQLSYWATTIATSVPEALPVIGKQVADVMRGGSALSAVTLGRFFALHVVVIPAVTAILMGGHFLMIRKTGIARPL
ncbi:MAG: cytochrome b N-terminal domain-containing protein [Candidatus Eremiobacteraeota bacterium]|nr:cytochrome b N-terminal domain-containing protein [Candidatus Eremiobacteraeota bacterium]